MEHILMYQALARNIQMWYLIEINLTSYSTLQNLKVGFHILDFHILSLITTLSV